MRGFGRYPLKFESGRLLAPSLLLSLVWFCGCAAKHYAQGKGDAGQFILQQAIAYGGHHVATNGLPVIGNDWRYIQDDYGVGILLPASEYQASQAFVRAAFGPPSNSAGWSVRDCGVAIIVQQTDKNTSVGIYPPMSDEKMTPGIRNMTKEVEKNAR
jgi:hypothetical protein